MDLSKRDADVLEITKTLESPGFKFVTALLNKEVDFENMMISKITNKPISEESQRELNLHIAIRNKLEVLRDEFADEVFKMVDETDLKFTEGSPVHNRLLVEINL